MFYFDIQYLIFVGPAMILSAIAAWRVKSTFARHSQQATRAGLTGASVAQRILADNGIRDVQVEPVQGFLSDHYDPRHKVLRLSPDVYNGHSISAVGVAAHEVGHAIQHARAYAPLRFRSAIVPLAQIGSNLSWLLFFIGLFMNLAGLVWAGIILFSASLLFTLVTLPVEFDASRRALLTLESGGYLRADEIHGARSVLRAAALTYVAAAITAIATLLYFLFRAGVLGGGRSDE